MLSLTKRCVHGPLGLFTLPDGGARWACTFCRDDSICSEHRTTADDADQQLAAGADKWVDLVSDISDCSFSGPTKPWKKKAQADLVPEGAGWCIECDAVSEDCSNPTGHRNVDSWRHIGELLRTRSDRSSNAQYFFDDDCVAMVLDWLSTLEVDRVICIGCPRLHEAILRSDDKTRSLLLDVDERMPKLFCGTTHMFNMCNATFFEESSAAASAARLQSVARPSGEHKLAVIIDPPFGIKPQLLANTVYNIAKASGSGTGFPLTMLFAPWYHGPTIVREFNEASRGCGGTEATAFAPMHPEVTYQYNPFQKARLRRGKKRRKQGGKPNTERSPIRCFVNCSGSRRMLLPSQSQRDTYKLCEPCGAYVPQDVIHCEKCDQCMCGDLHQTYIHCDKCDKCVRADYEHCDHCAGCFPKETHSCFAKRRRKEKANVKGQSEGEVPAKKKKKRKSTNKYRPATDEQ